MKKLQTLLFILIIIHSSFAEESDYNSYTWAEKPVTVQLTGEEEKLSSVTISSKKRVEYLIKNGQLEKYLITHTIQVLNDDRAVEASNKVYIPINYSSKLDNIRARVVMNGKVISEQGMADVKKLEEKEVQYYLLALEGVGKGAMVETIIYLQLSSSTYASEYLQNTSQIRDCEFTLVTPDYLIFNTKLYNSDVAKTDTVTEEKRYIHYRLKNVAGVAEEKYALKNANRIRVEYKFEKNTEYAAARSDKWSDMGQVYFKRIYTSYDKNAKEIDKLLKKLSLKDKSNEEKIFAIENQIKTTINLVQDAKDEELVATILKNKYANLFGITQLIALGLDRAKIPFELVISCDKDDKRFDPDFDSWSFLNDVVIFLPETNTYITPGNSLLRSGYLAAGLLGQSGLFIKTTENGKSKTSETKVKTIALNDISKSLDKHKMHLTLDEDLSNSTILYEREMSDYACMGVKSYYYYGDESQKKEFLENLITNGIKEIKVSNTKVENFDITNIIQYKAPLKISATLTTDAYLEKAGDKVLLKIGELIGPQEQIYQEKKRQNPIDMPYAHSYEREIRVQIPTGYKLDGLDKLNINYLFEDKEGTMFGFKSGYKIEGNELVVSCYEHYNRSSFPIEKFEEFRKVINAAADFNKITILVTK